MNTDNSQLELLIKGAQVQDNILYGPGFALSADFDTSEEGVRYSFLLPPMEKTSWSFVFGFTGVGCHYALTFLGGERLMRLDRVQDGVCVYLHHLALDLQAGMSIEIVWSAPSIRVIVDEWCVLNLYEEALTSGHWGIKTPHSVVVPKVERQALTAGWKNFKTVVIGDGFSNARWSNRHFISWPERLWGTKSDYLNACVAAGNSRRCEQIYTRLRACIDWGRVERLVLCFGSDDLIEAENYDSFHSRLEAYFDSRDGRPEVYVLGLPPLAAHSSAILERNRSIRDLVERSGGTYIDIHGALLLHPRSMTRGNYPNDIGQRVIAEAVSAATQDKLPDSQPPATHQPGWHLHGALARILYALDHRIRVALGVLD